MRTVECGIKECINKGTKLTRVEEQSKSNKICEKEEEEL